MPQIDNTLALSAGKDLPKFGPDWGVTQNALKTQIAMQQARDVQQSENALRAAFAGQQPGATQFTPQTINNLGVRSPEAAQQAMRMNALARPMATNEVLRSTFANQANRQSDGITLTPEALVDLGQKDPEALKKALVLQGELQDQNLRRTAADTKHNKFYTDEYQTGLREILAAHEARVKDGVDPGRSEEMTQADYKTLKERLAKGANPEFIKSLPPAFSVPAVRASIAAEGAADVAKQRALKEFEGKVYFGKDKESGETVRFRYTPDGAESADPSPSGRRDRVDVSKLTDIDEFGKREPKEFAQSKPVVVLDKDGNAVGTFAGRESTHGVGFVRGDTGDPITPPDGGRVILGTDKDAPAEAKEAVAQAVANYDVPPPPIGARGTKNSIEVLARAKELNPDFNAAKFGAAKVLREGYSRTTAKSPGQRIGSINTAVQHFDALQKLSDNLNNSPIPAKNFIVNYVQKNLGRPDVTSFDIAAQIVSDEALNAVIGAGAVFDRENLNKQLTNVRAPEQIKKGLGTLTDLMAGQAKTLRQQWKSAGLRESEWHEKLVPEAAELLDPYLTPNAKRPGNESAIPPKPAAGGAPASGTPQGNIPTVKTKAERDALPPGAKYYKEGDDLNAPPRTRE